jgi:putative endonuclease
MAKKDDVGRWGEELAAEHLRRRGYEILDRNWRCPQGEIDIVARDRGTLVIVEVKTRSSIAYGHPFEAVTPAKLARLNRLGFAWCVAHTGWYGRFRVDVVSVIGRATAEAEPAITIFEGVRA